MGFVTPIGHDPETVWSNLVEGVSGVGPISLFDTSSYSTKIAAQVKDFEPDRYMDRKTARHIGRYCQFALAASRMALEMAALDPAEMDPDEVGVILSSGIGGMEEIEKSHTALLQRGVKRISPFTVPMMIADMAAGIVAIHTHAGGPNYAIVSACASSGHGIGEAAEIIKRGDATAMLAGGAEATITPLTMGAFCQIKAVSERNDEPEKASRPFDLERDGFVMGEAGGAVVLEELEHARARGAHVYCELAGYATFGNAYHMTGLTKEGLEMARAIDTALIHARLDPTAIDYVNAHGSGTQQNDRHETAAVKRALGQHAYATPMSSIKSMVGHSLGAIGAIELVACVLALAHQVVPPTANYETPDPECDLDYVPRVARERKLDSVLSVGSGFGGFQSAVVLTRPREKTR
jgi:minimal PKS ketosynthase (KS/KS alpha)